MDRSQRGMIILELLQPGTRVCDPLFRPDRVTKAAVDLSLIVFIQLNSLCPLMSILIVEPEILVPIAVVDAVDHYGQALDLRVPASRATGVKDDRPGTDLRQ